MSVFARTSKENCVRASVISNFNSLWVLGGGGGLDEVGRRDLILCTMTDEI